MTIDLLSVLAAHRAWLRGEDGGSCADLRGADLSRADLSRADLSRADLSRADLRDVVLSGADLRGADLSGADLRGADLRDVVLSGARGIRHASVGWSGHGECGRTLVCTEIDGLLMFGCGCFWGDAESLQEYIDEGNDDYAPSRRRAMWMCAELVRDDGGMA